MQTEVWTGGGAEKLGVEELRKVFKIEQLDDLFNFLAAAKQLEQ